MSIAVGCAVLIGRKILIVEDEPLIGLDLQSSILDFGGLVVGPVGTVREAMAFAETEELDGAILDLRIREGLALGVAEKLLSRGIPFVIHSGQAETTLPRNWPIVPLINKPALPEHVIRILAALLQK